MRTAKATIGETLKDPADRDLEEIERMVTEADANAEADKLKVKTKK